MEDCGRTVEGENQPQLEMGTCGRACRDTNRWVTGVKTIGGCWGSRRFSPTVGPNPTIYGNLGKWVEMPKLLRLIRPSRASCRTNSGRIPRSRSPGTPAKRGLKNWASRRAEDRNPLLSSNLCRRVRKSPPCDSVPSNLKPSPVSRAIRRPTGRVGRCLHS